WATLLACVLFRSFDEWIFEAGLGGEHDATNALPKALSIFTPIGLDHRAFLGGSLGSIATTKLNAMSKNAIISAFFAKLDIAKNIAEQKGAKLEIAPKCATSNASKIYLKHKSLFLRQNFALALFSAKSLGAKWDKSVLAKMGEFDLQARAQKIYPNLLIDAGHNEHAAKAIKTHLLSTFGKRATTLVFNSFDDKDIKAVLSILAPCLKRILLYTYESCWRKLGTQNASKIANELGIPCCDFNKTEFLKELKSRKNNFLVFGSFVLVGEFLKEFNEFKKK
ncbi:bifunctional folylpolyglutamate synthase/dihydrofolate synthase, partial [Campylobacter sp.]|uniref:bifunctional folylpolyglutamate synthase/dihydrofolate synthase n=1 Tax=Campylobacter sp. TaxID=205 RepID=UPI002A8073AE